MLNWLDVPSFYFDGDRHWRFDLLELVGTHLHNPTTHDALVTLRHRHGLR